jgi:hypothetical protein
MFYNPLEQFEIYSVFSFIFGNLDFSIINASLSLVFGLLCLIISFQLLTKSQKQKTYLFSTNLSCLIDKTLLSFSKKFANYFPFIFTLLLSSLFFSFLLTGVIREVDPQLKPLDKDAIQALIILGMLTVGITTIRLFEFHNVTILDESEVDGYILPSLAITDISELGREKPKIYARGKPTIKDVFNLLDDGCHKRWCVLTNHIIIKVDTKFYVFYKVFSVKFFFGQNFFLNSKTSSFKSETVGLKYFIEICPKHKLSEIINFISFNPVVYKASQMEFRNKNISCPSILLQTKLILCYYNLWLFF